jgi:hypothetical protein
MRGNAIANSKKTTTMITVSRMVDAPGARGASIELPKGVLTTLADDRIRDKDNDTPS